MEQVVQLSLTESLRRLFEGVVGRVAFVTPGGPRIVPVNYAIYQGDVVFRTTPYSELATYGSHHYVVFEVDGVDPSHRQGWSILAKGTVTTVDDDAVLHDICRTAEPDLWVSGPRHLLLRLSWDELTGRRVG